MRYILLCWLLFSCTIQNENKINLIPKPQELITHNGKFYLSDRTGIDFDSLFLSEAQYFKKITSLPLNGSSNHISLKYRNSLAKEEFYIEVEKKEIKIEASTPDGIMRGIQTLRQICVDFGHKKIIEIPCLSIHDFPRFSWRGMLLDCCRHFMTKEFVMRYIDLLAYHKMNVLHWHLTEDQGWRIQIDKYPKLTEVGAYRIQKDGSSYGGFYTKEDIKEIINYAEERHITIVPEIEFPGHCVAAIASYPQLSCTGDSILVGNDWGVYKDIYCAGNDKVFEFMENVLKEVIDLFPSKYIHIGGDEVPKYRWEKCSKCQARISKENLKNEHELQFYFLKKIEEVLHSNDRKLIGWDEIMEGGISSTSTIQSWRGEEGGIKAAKNGNNVIMSPTSHCYFDYGLDVINLKDVYYYEPIPSVLTDVEASHILGAECNMWSERAPQELIDSKVFPRILAMSEVLWSSTEKDYEDFYLRVQNHYSILDSLGVEYGYESIPINSTVSFDSGSFIINLNEGSPGMKMEYKLDNGVWNDYNKPFNIDTTSHLIVRGFKNNKPYGEFKQQFIKHIGTGRNVQYNFPYSKDYIGKGDFNLTDGLLGSEDNFRDGYYQGFSGSDMEVIIDLGESKEISEISTSFFQYYLSWIILPTYVVYAFSEDGINFYEFKKIDNNISLMKEGKFKHKFTLNNVKERLRYIKVFAKNVGKLPDQHPATGSDAWIFIDEIIIN